MHRRRALGELVGLALLATTPAWADQDGDDVYRQWREGKKLSIPVEQGVVELVFVGDAPDASVQAALLWVHNSTRAIALYFGRFLQHVAVLIEWKDGAGVGHGTSWGYDGSIARVQVGRSTSAAQYLDDWVLVHELVHVSLPSLRRSHLWLAEGSATYVEPIARVQAGLRPEADTWGEFARGMPRGLPQSGDEGMDRTHTWGRTYWGGALFYLLADVEMRQRSDNRTGLQDALRAICRQSQGNSADWDVDRFIEVGDHATQGAVLRRLYDQMAEAPVMTNLPELWHKLGVEVDGTNVHLDDDAIWAPYRRAIARPSGAPPSAMLTGPST